MLTITKYSVLVYNIFRAVMNAVVARPITKVENFITHIVPRDAKEIHHKDVAETWSTLSSDCSINNDVIIQVR